MSPTLCIWASYRFDQLDTDNIIFITLCSKRLVSDPNKGSNRGEHNVSCFCIQPNKCYELGLESLLEAHSLFFTWIVKTTDIKFIIVHTMISDCPSWAQVYRVGHWPYSNTIAFRNRLLFVMTQSAIHNLCVGCANTQGTSVISIPGSSSIFR